MSPYDAEAWHDLFVMTGGAAAALVGLIFVAVSLNHEQILAHDKLPNLTSRTIGLLLGLLCSSAFVLAPQGPRWLGAELTGTAGVLTAFLLAATWRAYRVPGTPPHWLLSHLLLSVAGTVPILLAGITLLTGTGGGLYWLLAGLISAILISVYYAWILFDRDPSLSLQDAAGHRRSASSAFCVRLRRLGLGAVSATAVARSIRAGPGADLRPTCDPPRDSAVDDDLAAHVPLRLELDGVLDLIGGQRGRDPHPELAARRISSTHPGNDHEHGSRSGPPRFQFHAQRDPFQMAEPT